MKRILQAVVVAALFTGTQAQAGDAPIVAPSQWTHADRAAPGGAVDAFPGSAPDMIVLESQPTRAASNEAVVSAFPGSAPEMIVLEAKSTYADRFATDSTRHVSAAADPALSQ